MLYFVLLSILVFTNGAKWQLNTKELIKPSTVNQKLYTNVLKNPNTQLVIVSGPAGSGKTLLASQEAIKELFIGSCEKIILTRPIGNCNNEHGYLPGDTNQKMTVWSRPVLEFCKTLTSPTIVEKLQHDKKIELIPYSQLLGRTFDNSFVIADEVQLSSLEQMKLLLTRIGKNTKMCVIGDVKQSTSIHNGFSDLINRLHKNSYNTSMISYINLTEQDIQRSDVVKEIIKLYN
jgi:phosphate starvation-inducible PhoH-like protein